MTSQRLNNKVIVIIGGTSGLGLSAARACIAEGASVVVVGRDSQKCQQAIDGLGPESRCEVGDACDPETSIKAIRRACDDFGGFHGLYHVAGGSGRRQGDGPLDQISDDGWHFTVQLNLDSLFYSNRAAVQHFLAAESGGSILNMASVLAYSPSVRYFATHAYAATKAAAVGLTKTTAAYYANSNIRVNALAPALVDTPLAQRAASDQEIMQYVASKQPLDGGRIGHASDADEAVVYFMSDASRFVTGQVLAIDGGWSVTEGQYGSDSNERGE